MITVDQALAQVLALRDPLDIEHIPLRAAAGRTLAQDVAATRTQPPFAASSMDGYALRRVEVEPDAMFKVVGESAAGHRFTGTLKAGQAVRIFTGAPVPEGADFVVIQEDTTRQGDLITLGHKIGDKDNIRPAGGDFTAGQTLSAPRVLRPADIALLAAMNIAQVPVTRKPVIAILATGRAVSPMFCPLRRMWRTRWIRRYKQQLNGARTLSSPSGARLWGITTSSRQHLIGLGSRAAFTKSPCAPANR